MKYKGVTKESELPREYRILPHSLELRIPGFDRHSFVTNRTLAPEDISCEAWFAEFAERVLTSIGRTFLPVCRFSDGEYLFLLGWQSADIRCSRLFRILEHIRHASSALFRSRGFQSATALGVSAGKYSRPEWQSARAQFEDGILFVIRHGYVAWHLTWSRIPFQERFHPALARWWNANEVSVNRSNYVPFYFVYALLRGPYRRRVLGGRRILAVNSARGEKRERIVASLLAEGVREVTWCEISSERSLFDELSVAQWCGSVDLVLIGAGVGKLVLFQYLQPLNVPCLDAGYIFEIWADASLARNRAYCVPDSEWEAEFLESSPPWQNQPEQI